MNYFYNPITGEHIDATIPADWMGKTSVQPPTYDRTAGGCFWRDDHWEFVAATPPASAQIIAALSVQIQDRLDGFARTRNYDNANSMSKYIYLSDGDIEALPPDDRAAVYRYRAECRHFLRKVAQTWAVSERILAEVQTQSRPVPAGLSDFESELPVLDWPV